MSHIATIAVRMRNHRAIGMAASRLNLPAPARGTAEVFMEKKSGLILRLPRWTFPVVIDEKTGEVAYDNYEGRWGDIKELNRFAQRYAIEAARVEAQRHGLRMTEQAQPDGSVRVEIVAREGR